MGDIAPSTSSIMLVYYQIKERLLQIQELSNINCIYENSVVSIPNQDKENMKTELGDIVRYLRKKQGMRQEDLAENSELSLSTISKIEQGVYDITLFNLLKISKELHVDPGIIVSALNNFKEGKIKRAVLSVQSNR